MSQHRAILAAPVAALPAERRPAAGPIAILPDRSDALEAAVLAGGGTVNELSDDTRGLIWRNFGDGRSLAAVLDSHPAIGWVQLPLAGVERFRQTMADHPHVLWTSAKGAFAQPVAEHALALALALLRQLPRRILATSWGESGGTSLYGLRVLIVGAGGIAHELISLLKPFGVTIDVVRRGPGDVPGADRTLTAEHFLDVLPEADVVVIAAAATAETLNLGGETELRIMKDTAVLVNIARGSLVDTDALAGALASRQIAGAGLDVTQPEPLPEGHPLWEEPLVIITPHTADTPEMVEPLLAERVRANVTAFMGDGRFEGIVDPVAGY
jgi:phosphoglycerate dehydrogenase-like enzyme